MKFAQCLRIVIGLLLYNVYCIVIGEYTDIFWRGLGLRWIFMGMNLLGEVNFRRVNTQGDILHRGFNLYRKIELPKKFKYDHALLLR